MNLTDNEIIQEATEAIEKNLNAGCYVGGLLRIIKEQQAEIERLNAVSEICGECHKKYAEKIKQAKSEAYKELALKVKMLLETKAVLYSLNDRECEFAINQATALKAVDTTLNELTRNSHGKQ